MRLMKQETWPVGFQQMIKIRRNQEPHKRCKTGFSTQMKILIAGPLVQTNETIVSAWVQVIWTNDRSIEAEQWCNGECYLQ